MTSHDATASEATAHDTTGPVADEVAAMMARDAASATLGIAVVTATPGHARVRMLVTEQHVNGHAIAHGGLLFALADTAFACACNAGRPTTVAAQADIDFLAPARLGDRLEAEAVERRRAGRSGITDVTVRRLVDDGDDEVVAEFRGRSRTLRTG